jgi:hypothetical protein
MGAPLAQRYAIILARTARRNRRLLSALDLLVGCGEHDSAIALTNVLLHSIIDRHPLACLTHDNTG